MAEEFGRATLFVEGDDSQLRATLQRDEELTRKSATKMQANLKPIVGSPRCARHCSGSVANEHCPPRRPGVDALRVRLEAGEKESLNPWHSMQ